VLEPGSSLKMPDGDRRHLLVFDVPSSSHDETLQSAELRLLLTTTVHLRTSLASDRETGTGPTAPILRYHKLYCA
jgi:hypothetical protein